MGNIYCEQKKYPQAVKQYRMALDQVPNTHKDMRYVKGTRSENNIQQGSGKFASNFAVDCDLKNLYKDEIDNAAVMFQYLNQMNVTQRQ